MRWISVWTLILSAFAFWAIPDMLVKVICVLIAIISIVIMRYFPPDDGKDNKPFPWPESWKKVGKKLEVIFGWGSIIFLSALLLFALYMDLFN